MQNIEIKLRLTQKKRLKIRQSFVDLNHVLDILAIQSKKPKNFAQFLSLRLNFDFFELNDQRRRKAIFVCRSKYYSQF